MALGAVKTNVNISSGSVTCVVVVNGVTIKNKTSSSSWTDCDTFTEKDKNTITVTWTATASTNQGYFCSSHKSGGSPACHISVQQTTCAGSVRLATSPKTCNLNYNLPTKVGIPQGAPTYLETLDKLDQWSSAQYIPNGRNKLNL